MLCDDCFPKKEEKLKPKVEYRPWITQDIKNHPKKEDYEKFLKKTERLLIESKLQINLMDSSNMLALNLRVKFLTHWDQSNFLSKINKEVSLFHFRLMNQKKPFFVKTNKSQAMMVFSWYVTGIRWFPQCNENSLTKSNFQISSPLNC